MKPAIALTLPFFISICLSSQVKFPVSDQQITLKNPLFELDESINGETEEIKIKVYPSYKYSHQQLQLKDSNVYSNYMIFWVDIYSEGSLIKSYIQEYGYNGRTYSSSGDISIPSYTIPLKKGPHEIEIKIQGRYSKEEVIFKNIYIKKVNIIMPDLALVFFRGTDFTFTHSAFDPGSPMSIFSKTAGHGYADPYLEIVDNKRNDYYSSGCYVNDLAIPYLSAHFMVPVNSMLSLQAWDADDFSKDDKMGEFPLKKIGPGLDTSEFNISNENVLSGKVFLSNRPIPYLLNANYTATDFNYNGANGIKIESRYDILNIAAGDIIEESILPEFTRADINLSTSDFHPILMGQDLAQNEERMRVVSSHFIPYASLLDSIESFDYHTQIANIEYPLGAFPVKADYEVPDHLEDASVDVSSIIYEYSKGFTVNLKCHLPSAYEYFPLYMEIDVVGDDGVNYTDSLIFPKYTYAFKRIDLKSANRDITVILPLHTIKEFPKLQMLQITYKIKTRGKGYVIGSGKETRSLNKTDFMRGNQFTYKISKKQSVTGRLVASIKCNGRTLEWFDLKDKKGSFDLEKYWFHQNERFFVIEIMEIKDDNIPRSLIAIPIFPAEGQKWRAKNPGLKYSGLKKLIISKIN